MDTTGYGAEGGRHAGLAAGHLGRPVATRTFHDVDEVACYDGIWACASLLHLAAADIPDRRRT